MVNKKANPRLHFNYMKHLVKCKRSQVTIFVIIAIIIVAAVAGYFMMFGLPGGGVSIESPQDYIESCAEGALEEVEEIFMENNGFFEDDYSAYTTYKGEKVPYLCIVSEFYEPCIPQEPILIEKIRRTIEEYVQVRVEDCFSTIVKEYEGSGYDIEEGELSIEIEFPERRIRASVSKDLSLKRDESVNVFDKFSGEISSPLYDLVDLSRKIINFETAVCEFDKDTWDLVYSEILVKRFRASDQSKIYSLLDRKTDKELKFAVKTCLLPAGI